MATLGTGPDNLLAPCIDFGVFCAYAAAAVIGASVTLMRRDA